MTDPAKDPKRDSGTVWRQPASPGEGEVLKGYGGVATPLLAGFSLATIAGLIVSDHHPPLYEYSIGAFVVATIGLLFSMQFGFMALRHHPVPSDRLSWLPEATTDRNRLEDERWAQALDMTLVSIYRTRMGLLYNLGLLAFIGGLTLLLTPRHWTIVSGTAFAVAALGGITEAIWIFGGYAGLTRPLWKWLQPGYAEVATKVDGPGAARISSVLHPPSGEQQ